MKRIFLILFFVFCLNGISFADKLIIPFSCWPQNLKTAFNETGRKLDLNSSDRDNNSWGYLVNEGSSFTIYTYKSVTNEDFQVIQDIIFDIEMKKR